MRLCNWETNTSGENITSRALSSRHRSHAPKTWLLLMHDQNFTHGWNLVSDSVRRAARRAHVTVSGAHRLRHTFCSHLAMRGAPARAIQEVAGHADLSTTQRYMHLSPAAVESAIRLLDGTARVATSVAHGSLEMDNVRQ